MNSRIYMHLNEKILKMGLRNQKQLYFVQYATAAQEVNTNYAPGFQYMSLMTNAATQA